MNKRLLKNTLIVVIIVILNLATFLYFLADSPMTSPLLRELLFAALFGVLSVFFGHVAGSLLSGVASRALVKSCDISLRLASFLTSCSAFCCRFFLDCGPCVVRVAVIF